MKFIEIQGNLLIGVSNEELLLVEKIKTSLDPISKRSLTEREQEVAKILVTRGVLDRFRIDNDFVFGYNSLQEVWKD